MAFVWAIARFLRLRREWRMQAKKKELLKVHSGRTRKIYGCLECGKQLFPPCRLWRCGSCAEDTTLCASCFSRGGKCVFLSKHAHQNEAWHWDKINLELPWIIPHPLTLPNIMRAAFSQHAERDCLGIFEFVISSMRGSKITALDSVFRNSRRWVVLDVCGDWSTHRSSGRTTVL